MSTRLLYDFDPYARLENNLVEELVNVSVVAPDQFSFIVPKAAPFFKDDFEIVHLDSNYPLREGLDYHFTHEFKAATLGTAKPVYGSVTFIRHDFKGNFRIRYRTIGGIWVNRPHKILEILTQKLINPRTVLWEDVADIPTVFPPIDHMQDVEDLVGMSEVVNELGLMTQAIKDSQRRDDAEERFFAPQVTYKHINNEDTTWSRIATFDSTDFPASDLVLGISGAERFDVSDTSYYNLTIGVRGGSVSMSVANLTRYDGGCEFGYRYIEELSVVEVWVKNVPFRGKLTATVLSKGHRFTLIGSDVNEEPANIVYVPVLSVGSGISDDSHRLGGKKASTYVTMELFVDYMARMTAKLDELSGGESSVPQVRPASYFVSRMQFTFSMSDFIRDLEAVVEYVDTGSTSLPDEITYVPPQLNVPTGTIDFFISRAEFMSAMTEFKDELIKAIDLMEEDGVLVDRNTLLAYVNPPATATFPFPITTTEETTGVAAINYVSVVEFNQLMAEIVLVINEMINALKNVSDLNP